VRTTVDVELPAAALMPYLRHVTPTFARHRPRNFEETSNFERSSSGSHFTETVDTICFVEQASLVVRKQ
jgi:hypothetical protein